MDNEKYGIELDLITAKFNKKIKAVKQKIKSLDKNIKIDIDIDTNKISKNLKNEVEKAQKKIKNIKPAFDPNDVSGLNINYWNDASKNMDGYIDKVNKARSAEKEAFKSYNGFEIQKIIDSSGKSEQAIEKVKRKITGFRGTIDETNTKISTIGSKIQSIISKIKIISTTKINIDTSKISKSIDRATSKIKRFGLALFGIRSIYSLVSRASSAYLSQDTELANKLQAVWVGLGSLLAPIIDGIANILIKAVKYINVFITALTGVDLLAKATAKSMNNTAKSAKSLNKALAGFDELTNLDTTDAGTGIDTGWADAFKNVDIDITWADRIKAFGEWIKENKDGIISAIMGIAGAILAVKLGIGAIQALGVGVMIYAGIKLLSELKKYLDALNPALENNGTSFMQFGNIVKYIGLAVLGFGLIIGGIPAIITGVVILIVGVLIKYWDKIKEGFQKAVDWLSGIQEKVTNWFVDNIDKIYEKFGYFGVGVVAVITTTFNWIVEIIKGAIGIVMSVFDGLFTGIKQIFDGILMIFKGEFKNGFINIGKGIVNALIGVLNGLISGVNAIVYPIRELIVGIGQVMGKNWTMQNISIPRISYLDVGTNYVPEDQVAMIHKGEAVIPKKFNSKEYFGSGNEETNAKLEELIEAVRNIEINPYTTIKDVGKASLSYINNKSRQLGESVVV